MTIKKGNYVIAALDKHGKSPYLLKVLAVDKTEIHGVVEKFCHIEKLRLTATVPNNCIMVDLGTDPKNGSVYGVNVTSRFVAKKVHDDFGTLNFFYKPEKEVGIALMTAFSKAYKILKSRGLEFLVNDIIWEIHPTHKEKYAGMYMHSKNEKSLSTIKINPEVMPNTEFVYVILHELGHRLHFEYLTSRKLNALWVKLYNTSIKVAAVKKETSQTLLDALMSQEDSPSNFKSLLAEDEALAYKWILRTIKEVHSLGVKELDLLFEADMKDEITKLWPIRNIPRRDLHPIVTEYSTVSYKELLAESFAISLLKRDLPEPIMRLMEKSISYAKANREKS